MLGRIVSQPDLPPDRDIFKWEAVGSVGEHQSHCGHADAINARNKFFVLGFALLRVFGSISLNSLNEEILCSGRNKYRSVNLALRIAGFD